MVQKVAKGKTSREILAKKANELLWSTKFDKQLFRITPQPLVAHPDEYNLSVASHEVAFAVFWEYRREIKYEYDNLRQLHRDDYKPSKGGAEYLRRQQRWRAEHTTTWIELADLFPLPISEIKQSGFLNISPTPPCTAFKDLTPSDFEYLRRNQPPSNWSVHAIQLDWDLGAAVIQTEFGKWIDEENRRRAASEKRPTSKRGRSSRAIIERRLEQLAAWRGHRSKLNHGEYLKLKPHSWSDKSAYRHGSEKAREVFDDLIKKEGWMLFSDR